MNPILAHNSTETRRSGLHCGSGWMVKSQKNRRTVSQDILCLSRLDRSVTQCGHLRE